MCIYLMRDGSLIFLGLAMIRTHMTAASVSGADNLRSSWSMVPFKVESCGVSVSGSPELRQSLCKPILEH